MEKWTLDDLYRYYLNDVYRFLLSLARDHHVAEDLVQETFYRAYVAFDKADVDKVKPWLFRVARNVFIDHYRKHKRVIPSDDSEFTSIPGPDSPERDLLLKEELAETRQWIEKLPEKQKQALLLCDVQQLAYKEAAEIMGVTLSHFKILVFRARQALRQSKERSENRGR
jgi:RNA polymerase sigma-70 factor (ECF subfamily)